MNKRLIWVEGDDFSGWCCSHCQWGMTAPHLESTVAALAFNRLAQEHSRNTIAPTALSKTANVRSLSRILRGETQDCGFAWPPRSWEAAGLRWIAFISP